MQSQIILNEEKKRIFNSESLSLAKNVILINHFLRCKTMSVQTSSHIRTSSDILTLASKHSSVSESSVGMVSSQIIKLTNN